jgi:hypothetical protein
MQAAPPIQASIARLADVNAVLADLQTHNPVALRSTYRGKLVPAQKKLQIGKRGGLYYKTPAGTTVYLKEKDKRICAAKRRLANEVDHFCRNVELRNDDIPAAIKEQVPGGRYIRKYGAFKPP